MFLVLTVLRRVSVFSFIRVGCVPMCIKLILVNTEQDSSEFSDRVSMKKNDQTSFERKRH